MPLLWLKGKSDSLRGGRKQRVVSLAITKNQEMARLADCSPCALPQWNEHASNGVVYSLRTDGSSEAIVAGRCLKLGEVEEVDEQLLR